MLNLCDTNHEEVCYEGRECPACNLFKEKEAAEDLAEERLEEIDELKDKIEELEEKLNSLNLGD